MVGSATDYVDILCEYFSGLYSHLGPVGGAWTGE